MLRIKEEEKKQKVKDEVYYSMKIEELDSFLGGEGR